MNKIFTIKNQKVIVLFIMGVNLCLLGLILVLNIYPFAGCNVFLNNILNFIFSKLLLFICVLPVVFLSSRGIISGFFGVDVKQKYLTEINKPYIYIYMFIFTFISIILIKYNGIFADNNFKLVLNGEGQQISLTSTGIDYFSKTLDLLGNAGVMAASIKVVGKLLTQHPDLGMGPKTGYFILGTSGTLITYNIIKSIAKLGGGSSVVSTTIMLGNSNIPVNAPDVVRNNLLSIENPGHSDLISGLNDTLYTVNKQVWNQQIQTR